MYSASKFDGIAFSPSKNIKVAGVGVFGPIKEGYSFLGIVRLVEGQSIEGRIVLSLLLRRALQLKMLKWSPK
mgnify:CR=1 FL=1